MSINKILYFKCVSIALLYVKYSFALFLNVTDRQTDILLTEKKVITDLFVIEMKEIYVHVYTRLLIC